MKAAEGRVNRVFVIRLEDGDCFPSCLEEFAANNGVNSGLVTLIGGTRGGNIVSGPRCGEEMPPDPVIIPVVDVHEVVATGVIAPDEGGCPRLHLHGTLGRSGRALAGCFRPGLETWLVGEVIMLEVTGANCSRLHDERSGFPLLEP